MLIRPLCSSFHQSLFLSAPSFVPALFFRLSITLYLSFLRAFTGVSLPSFCRSHVLTTRPFWGQPIPGIDESPLSPSTPLFSVNSSSVFLEGSLLPSSTPMSSHDLLLFSLSLVPSIHRLYLLSSFLPPPPLVPSIVLLSLVSASVAQSIRFHGQRPSDAPRLRSLTQFLLHTASLLTHR